MTRVVVLGGGFAGVETVSALEKGLRGRTDVEITLVSDRSYLLFTPLLPQAGSSLVEPRHLIQPIRAPRGGRAFRLRRHRVLSVDLERRRVLVAQGTLDYHRLLID